MIIRCMFRTLGIERTYDNALHVRGAPTYASRDGIEVPEHKSFWKATPSGSLQIQIHKDEPLAQLFEPGGYVYLDILDGDVVADVPADAIRTSWHTSKVILFTESAFRIEYTANRSRPSWCYSGELAIDVTNLDAWPELRIDPGGARGKMIAFSKA